MKVICSLLLFTLAWTSGAQTITYGDLLVEDREGDSWKQNQIGVTGGYDVTNPYLNTYSYGLAIKRRLNRHFSRTFEVVGFTSSPSRYNKNLERDLKTFGVEAEHDRPAQILSLKVSAHLLQGRLNFFGQKAVPVRFDVRGGLGLMSTNRQRFVGSGTWGVGPELMVSQRTAVTLGFDQDVQSMFGGRKIYRNRLNVGLSFLFD